MIFKYYYKNFLEQNEWLKINTNEFAIFPNLTKSEKKCLIYLCKIFLSVVIENQSHNVIMMWINIICLEKYEDKI